MRIKILIKQYEIKMEYLHKVCEIYVSPPDDTKKVIDVFKNTDFLVSSGRDDNGNHKYEVFERSEHLYY